MSAARCHGFALVDVLIALLLLATALLGACGALIHALRATHEALLVSRAVDLVTDLDEDLQNVNSITQQEDLMAAWRARVAEGLPVSGLAGNQVVSWTAASGALQATQLSLGWRARENEALRQLQAPLSAALEPAR